MRRFTRVVDLGPADSRRLDALGEALGCWAVHRAARLQVAPATPVVADAVHVVHLGPLRAPVRVVEVITLPTARGFCYQALPGHPERGWERFVVEQVDGRLRFVVQAASTPAAVWLRALGPVADIAQDVLTWRYLRAARRVAARV